MLKRGARATHHGELTMSLPPHHLGYDPNEPIRALVIGGSGGVGAALVDTIRQRAPDAHVVATGRRAPFLDTPAPSPRGHRLRFDITEPDGAQRLAEAVAALPGFAAGPNLVINATGVLHGELDGQPFGPERTWRHLEMDVLQHLFAVHASGLAMLFRHVLPLMPRTQRGVFATLSARVGSIGDNRLGGWYGYRASKAAQHMLVKTAALEARRRYPQLAVVALHPGTVQTALSDPFSARVPADKLFSPERSAGHLLDVIAGLGPARSGEAIAWDGAAMPW